MNEPINICFIVDHPKITLGGAERQALGIARLMKRRGFEVSLVTKSVYDGVSIVYEDGIKLIQIGEDLRTGVHRPKDFAGLSARMLLAVITEHADVYYSRTYRQMTALIALACRSIERPLIFGSSSITEATDNFNGLNFDGRTILPRRVTRAIYCYGLSKVNALVAQTNEIAALFRNRLEMTDIRCIPSLAFTTLPPAPKTDPPFVLYVTRLVPFKRPLLFLKLAKSLPNTRFVLAGYGPMEAEVRSVASGIPNLAYIGRVSPEKSLHLTSTAAAFVCTSMYEGFQNTLLEAAACRTPFLSFYDPDEVICRYNLGKHVNSFEELVAGVREFVGDSDLRQRIGQNGSDYVREHHDSEKIGDEYEQLFREKAWQLHST